jgi:hypothetical protein
MVCLLLIECCCWSAFADAFQSLSAPQWQEKLRESAICITSAPDVSMVFLTQSIKLLQ